MDEIKPTPRNTLAGMLADALAKGNETLSSTGKVGSFASEVIGLPAMARTMDRISYGEPLTTGKGMTTKPRADTMDAAIGAFPLAQGANAFARKAGPAMVKNALAPTSPAMAQRGAIVYHGSPHTFDKFDMSKIGTGEGAQAYGHGLYFADSPAVANEYKTALAGVKLADGTTVKPDWTDPRFLGVNELRKAGGDVATARAAVMKQSKDWPEQVSAFDDLVKRGVSLDNGNFYKVDLPDEHIAKMLDWDKPLSQQSPEVQKAIEATGIRFPGNATGKQIHDAYAARAVSALDPSMRGNAGANQVAASQTMREAGIPGIRYLDGGSRGTGQGTSNYVVFDDKLPKILERNGKSLTEQLADALKGPEYGMAHRPVTVEGGAARLHDLTPAFGDDIYGKSAAQFYGTGNSALDRQTLSVLNGLRGKPDALVTAYRAVPKDAPASSFNHGDWVTVNRNYAKQHGESTLDGNYRIIEQRVPASHLTTNADSFHEQGYYPPK
jgi:hypothetical protein